ncbi:hypothetical protein K3495_g5218 [Podosphaera aphanis]|nr:hypothetical protein K3495_g5218 [Podosphaera aphanis]
MKSLDHSAFRKKTEGREKKQRIRKKQKRKEVQTDKRNKLRLDSESTKSNQEMGWIVRRLQLSGIGGMTRDELRDTGKAIYAALPWRITTGRAAIHQALKNLLISDCKLEGLHGIQSIGVKYFVLIFEDEVRRDAALESLKNFKFATSEMSEISLVILPFGERSDICSLWTITSDLMLSGEEVLDGICAMLLKLNPEYTGKVFCRRILEEGLETGSWALGLSKRPMKVSSVAEFKHHRFRLYSETLVACSLCGLKRHNIFSCKNSGSVELGKREFRRII